jgi:hypothetical protein
MFIQTGHCRLDDVGRWDHTPGIAPTTRCPVQVQGGLGLCPGEAELLPVADVPGRRILPQDPQPVGQFVLVQPGDTAVALEQRLHPVRYDKLRGTGAVLADMA